MSRVGYLRVKAVWWLLVAFMGLGLAACNDFNNVRPDNLAPTKDHPIAVLSCNIRIGAGTQDWGRSPYRLKDEVALDLDSVAAAIRSVDPDIVGLQEVLGAGQAAFLGKALNMNYAYVPHGMDAYGAWWGVAFLSKYKILDVARREISYGRGNTKSILIGVVDVAGTQVAFVSIHKDRDLSDGESLRNTVRALADRPQPMVLIGDLNMLPDDPRHEILAGRFADSAVMVDTESARFARERGTFLGRDQDTWGKRIDYVLVERDRFDVLDAGLLKEAHWEASDHVGYYAKIRLR